MAKIRVKNPVVEMNGDEMTGIIWLRIREKLILPYLDIDLKYFDLGIESRDRTEDRITLAMSMFNLDVSIKGFARACVNYGLSRNYPVYLSTKNTILKVYDGRFKSLFQKILDAEFKDKFARQPYLRPPADRRHSDFEPEMERRLPLGVQELRRRRVVPTPSRRATARSA